MKLLNNNKCDGQYFFISNIETMRIDAIYFREKCLLYFINHFIVVGLLLLFRVNKLMRL